LNRQRRPRRGPESRGLLSMRAYRQKFRSEMTGMIPGQVRSCSDESVGSQLDRYLLGGLPDKENERFQAHLSECESCRRELEILKPLVNRLQDFDLPFKPVDTMQFPQGTDSSILWQRGECTDESVGTLLGPYCLGILSDEDQERFELHLFDCEFCRQELEEMLPVATRLRQEQARNTERGRGSYSLWLLLIRLWTFIERLFDRFRHLTVPAPAVGLIAVVVLLSLVASEIHVRKEKELLRLLPLESLPYQPMRTRGLVSSQAQDLVEKGMNAYLAGRYDEAAKSLRLAVERDSLQGDLWLYLGVSYYLDREPARAIATLGHAENLAGKDPYGGVPQAHARWYLAQANLMRGNADRADSLLELLIPGPYADRARSEIAQITSRRR
jgi:hypothetical protein